MVILETTTCAMPFTAALCEREQPAQPHRSACAPKTCPIHPAQPHSAHPGASQLVVVLVRHRDPVDDLPEGTGSGVALGLCHPRPMLPPSGHGLAVTGTPHPQGAPPKNPTQHQDTADPRSPAEGLWVRDISQQSPKWPPSPPDLPPASVTAEPPAWGAEYGDGGDPSGSDTLTAASSSGCSRSWRRPRLRTGPSGRAKGGLAAGEGTASAQGAG